MRNEVHDNDDSCRGKDQYAFDLKVTYADATSVTLHWTPYLNAQKYQVYKNKLYTGTTISKTGYFSDFGLNPNQKYEYTVTAVDNNNIPLQSSDTISVVTKSSSTIRTHYKVLALAFYPQGITDDELVGIKTYFKHRLAFYKLASFGSAILEPYNGT